MYTVTGGPFALKTSRAGCPCDTKRGTDSSTATKRKAVQINYEAVEGRRLRFGDKHPHAVESMNNLIELYEAWGKPEKAEQWQAKMQQAEAVDE